jgi:hypothetical protein
MPVSPPQFPNPATLFYYDNANVVPAPVGVSGGSSNGNNPVLFNNEPANIWMGWDQATQRLCIANYNRTVVICCFSPGAGGAIIPYSGNVAVNSGDDAFVVWDVVGSYTPQEINFNMPRNGILQNLSVFITLNGVAPEASTVFMIRVSSAGGPFVNTTQTITVTGNGTGQFYATGAPVVVAKGDRVSLKVITGIGVGAVSFTGGLEV